MTLSLPRRERDIVRENARAVLIGNLRSGRDPWHATPYAFVCPSRGRYPWQWFWDSCFHAIALARLEPELAEQELLGLLSAQEDDGFIGHMVFWGQRPWIPAWAYLQSKRGWRPSHSAIIQPPLLARAAWQVYMARRSPEYLERVVEPLQGYYRWLAENRDATGDGLISIITPYESGMDHSPIFDHAIGLSPTRPSRAVAEVRLRSIDIANRARNYRHPDVLRTSPFLAVDVLVNTLYADSLTALGWLCAEAGALDAAADWHAHAERVEQALMARCQDPGTGLFFDEVLTSPPGPRVLTPTALLPLLLPSLPRETVTRLVEWLMDPTRFWTPYPLPSVAISEPSFRGHGNCFLWRGPSWLNTTWMVHQGLRRHGYEQEAELLAGRCVELVLKEGFREFYDPFSGEGMGAKNFGWSTLVVDMLDPTP